MFSDTNQVTHSAMASGEKSRSRCGRPKGFLLSMFTQKPATTPPTCRRGRLTAFLLTFLLAAFGVFLATGAFAQQQQQPISPSTQPPSPKAPPQSDLEGTFKIRSQVHLVVL